MSRPTGRARAALITATTLALVVGTATLAQAHVHVETDSNVVGSDATLTFRVPTESDTASTVKIVVTLPIDHPLLSVSPQAVAGFTAEVTQAPLPAPVVVEGTTLTKAPHLVTWTATGQGIPPEQFADLGLLVENLPDAPSLAFPTAQYYSDGTVVSWDEPTPAGGAEPEHPTPTIDLVAAGTASGHTAAAASTASSTGTSGDGPALALSVLAVLLAVAALAVALLGRRRPDVAAAAP